MIAREFWRASLKSTGHPIRTMPVRSSLASIGQSAEFFTKVGKLAEEADEAKRKCHRED
jgi:hypothetical protein